MPTCALFLLLPPACSGYISPYFVNDPKTQKVEFEDAAILLVEKKVRLWLKLFFAS